MPHKVIRMERTRDHSSARRPVMVAIAGDSAAGKTTLTKGIAAALGASRVTTICVDDYHRYDRQERKGLPFTALHPRCNYVEIMEQHLQLLATGQPILKPVYDHDTGQLTRPELVEPREFVIVEGLLPLYSKLTRACFDIAVYLDPPERIRREWKVSRDVRKRGYTVDQVLAELERREPESAQFIRPQRAHADIVVRFAPAEGHDDTSNSPLSVELMLRPTVRHTGLRGLLAEIGQRTVQLRLIRDEDGIPVDALHVHGYAPREESRMVQKAIWSRLGLGDGDPVATLGDVGNGRRSESLAITQLVVLDHLLRAT
ncbi:phosphoribulokinase [Thermasporomyces composti]|jgi:phosphoribulokinase|uniref:phosphoribulokinase n=2 Tax=Thermasporomyces composti TaxID=696763 RepID=A0A3D9V7P8_THECX|nr:phosphoribulokinase [Thermasporomyces composti]